MRCSDQLESDPVSNDPVVDCDISRVGKDPQTADTALRRASSLPEDPLSTSRDSPTTPPCTSRQAKVAAGSRSSSGGIAVEKAKWFMEKSSIVGKTATRSGCTSPSSSSVSSRCSRNDSVESPSHSSKYGVSNLLCCVHNHKVVN